MQALSNQKFRELSEEFEERGVNDGGRLHQPATRAASS